MVETILTAVASSAAAFALLVYFGRTWFEARLRASIEHEYKKQFDQFSREQDRKDKVELVAHLLAEFLKTPQGEQLPRDQRLLLNRLSFMTTIWLPSKLAIEVSKRIQNTADAKQPWEIVLLARKELLGDESLKAEHVTTWSPLLEQRGDPVLVRTL